MDWEMANHHEPAWSICRYTSENSFIRIFKKITGTTPGNYRKDAQELHLNKVKRPSPSRWDGRYI